MDEVTGPRDVPSDSEAWYLQGMAQLEAGALDDAITSFEQALAEEDNSGIYKAWYGKGLALSQLKCYDAAIDCYRNALKTQPDKPEIWLAQAKVLGTMARYREAISSYETALNLQRQLGDRQGEAQTLLTLNMLYPLDGRMQESARAFQQMTTILNELETQSDEPFRMSLIGGTTPVDRLLHFWLNWTRRLNQNSVQSRVRSILVRLGWGIFFGISLVLLLIAMLRWSVRRSKQHSSA